MANDPKPENFGERREPSFWATVLNDGGSASASRGSVMWLEWIGGVAFIGLVVFLWSRDLQPVAIGLALPGLSFWMGYRRSCAMTLLYLTLMGCTIVYFGVMDSEFVSRPELQVAAYVLLIIFSTLAGKSFRVFLLNLRHGRGEG